MVDKKELTEILFHEVVSLFFTENNINPDRSYISFHIAMGALCDFKFESLDPTYLNKAFREGHLIKQDLCNKLKKFTNDLCSDREEIIIKTNNIEGKSKFEIVI